MQAQSTPLSPGPFRDHCKRAILFLSSSKILTPHPPLRPASVYSPPLLRGEDRLARRRGGRGVNILEDDRNSCPLTMIFTPRSHITTAAPSIFNQLILTHDHTIKLWYLIGLRIVHRREITYRLAMATFWRTVHQNGKFSPVWLGWGCTTSPFHSIYHHEQSCGVRSS